MQKQSDLYECDRILSNGIVASTSGTTSGSISIECASRPPGHA